MLRHAPNPYMLFCSENRPEIKVLLPDATIDEIDMLLCRMWAVLDDQAKRVSSSLFGVWSILTVLSIVTLNSILRVGLREGPSTIPADE